MRRLMTVACVLVGLGCGGDDVPPPTPRDGGARDAGTLDGGEPSDGEVPMDASVDGAADGAVGDGGADDGGAVDGGSDAGTSDGGSFDGGSFTFGDECLDSEGAFDLCLCPVPECDPAAATPCAPGLRCLRDGCDRTTCQPGGNGCAADADCPSGSTCVATRALDGSLVDVCRSSSGDCNDSRDCALGFSCDGGSCVDRRVACARHVDCPFGFFCNDTDPWSRPFCARGSRRCDSFVGACPPFFSCVDVDGDGASECRRNGEACDTNDDCPSRVCGFDPSVGALACGSHGPCRNAGDCGAGFTCADAWGDGVRECVPSGGTCATSDDCAELTICGAPTADEPRECVGG